MNQQIGNHFADMTFIFVNPIIRVVHFWTWYEWAQAFTLNKSISRLFW